MPKSLGIRMLHESVLRGHHGDKHVSSSENEGMGGQTPEGSLKVKSHGFVEDPSLVWIKRKKVRDL